MLRSLVVKARLDFYLGFDAKGAAFWKQNFQDQATVEWNKFVEVICHHFSHSHWRPDNKIFQSSIIPIHSNFTTLPVTISLEQYQNFLLWFGPFEGSTKVKSTAQQTSGCCLDNMDQLINTPWFWGNKEFSLAEPGSYAVRFCSGLSLPISRAPYAVGVFVNNAPVLLKVYFRENRTGLEIIELSAQSDDLSIIALVDELKKNILLIL